MAGSRLFSHGSPEQGAVKCAGGSQLDFSGQTHALGLDLCVLQSNHQLGRSLAPKADSSGLAQMLHMTKDETRSIHSEVLISACLRPTS